MTDEDIGSARLRLVLFDRDHLLRLIAQLGFEKTGVQWDEEDGEEIVFELAAQ